MRLFQHLLGGLVVDRFEGPDGAQDFGIPVGVKVTPELLEGQFPERRQVGDVGSDDIQWFQT